MPVDARQSELQDALEILFQYVDPAKENDLPFTFSRLTDDLVTDSFLGWGDLADLERKDERGVLRSPLGAGSGALMLKSGGGVPKEFPIGLFVDLNDGRAWGEWALPNDTRQTPSFQLDYLGSADNGLRLLFGVERSPDGAAYALTFRMT